VKVKSYIYVCTCVLIDFIKAYMCQAYIGCVLDEMRLYINKRNVINHVFILQLFYNIANISVPSNPYI
jgi:hypothetical protein